MKKILISAIVWIASATAMAFPDRPVTLVVPFAAGGPSDKVARDLAEALRGKLGSQPIIVETVSGAGGTIGANKVAKAAADGHTLLLYQIGMATTPALYRSLPYKPLEDFEYLGIVNEVPMTLIGRPNLPAKNYGELLKWMADNKGKITLANAGLGGGSHLCGLLLQQSLHTDMTTVPYRGTAPAITDVMGGQVDLMCDMSINTAPQIAAGKVKAFAVTTSRRLTAPGLSQLPTLRELGLSGFEVSIWHGLYAPKGTPKPVLDQLNAALRSALQDPAFLKRQEALGAVVITDARLSPAEHKKFVEAEIKKWGQAIRAAGQYAD
jgi:tripartite-type tricarboxylate transporter receptor subunit TctC